METGREFREPSFTVSTKVSPFTPPYPLKPSGTTSAVSGTDFKRCSFSGFFLGGETLRRSLHDIIPPQRKKAFMSQLISTVVSKQPIFLRVSVLFVFFVFVFFVLFQLYEIQLLVYLRQCPSCLLDAQFFFAVFFISTAR